MYALSDKWLRFKVLAGVFFRQKFVLGYAIASGLVLAGSFLLIYVMMHDKGSTAVLHYNVYFGVDLIGNWYALYKLPFLGLLFFTLHTGLALFFFQTEKMLSHLLLFMGAVLVVMQCGATVLLILANQ